MKEAKMKVNEQVGNKDQKSNKNVVYKYSWITDETPKMSEVMNYSFHKRFYRDYKAVRFLERKGISEETGRKHGLQVCEMNGGKYLAIINDDGSIMRYLCYPSNADADGEIHDTIIKKGLSGFFNYERLLRKQDLMQGIVFLTDNIFTALSLEEMGYDAVSINHPNQIDKLLWANKFKFIVGAFDNDMVGDYLNSCLKNNNYFYIDYSKDAYLDNYKTINEAMMCDKNAVKDSLSRVMAEAIRFYLQNKQFMNNCIQDKK